MPYGPRSPLARLLRRFAVLAFLSQVAPAFAGSAPFTLNQYAPNPGVMPGGGWQWSPGSTFADPPPIRTWSGAGTGAGRVLVGEGATIAGRAGPLVVQIAQRVTLAEAAGAIASCLVRNVVCAATVAAGAFELYRRYRGRPAGDGQHVEFDPGQSQISQRTWLCENPRDTSSRFTGASPNSACLGLARSPYYTRSYVDGIYTVSEDTVITGCTTNQYATTCTYDQHYVSRVTSSGSVATDTHYSGTWVLDDIGNTLMCPPVVDFYDPAYSVPGGPPGPDGKCPTGVYSERVSPADAAKKVVAFPPPVDDPILPSALRQAVENGSPAASTIETTGPATQTGTPVKTTTTDATGTKTTTETPTYTYHYDGDKITYDTTVNTTVVNSDGSTTTTTTTTEGSKPPEEDKDPCTLHPDRIGCMTLGAAPDDAIPKSSKSVDFSPENLGLPEACPAPVDLPHGQQISYQPLCDGLVQVRPLVIAIGFLMAGGIVVAALRS